MSDVSSERLGRSYRLTERSGEGRGAVTTPSSGMRLLLGGLALAALGWFAWSKFGPDLIRYMKIKSM